MDSYILHTFLLITILLLIIAIISYHYIKYRQKTYLHISNIKVEENELKTSLHQNSHE